MKSRFVDTFFYLALLNQRDACHDRAIHLARRLRGRFITSAWVLTELADAFSAPGRRSRCVHLIEQLRVDSSTVIIPPDETIFEAGYQLYVDRPDKAWSLTDCISFVIMQDQGLTEALTGDHHFEQAGFVALLV